ncbi:MAG: helix-turn-helix transcriptional regulator [Marinifilaceae bacterium]|jgi:AraC-like DNA-binding protein|nr:helix-turn-helix transcriptional regulator [Marinifilaceae bacterium]
MHNTIRINSIHELHKFLESDLVLNPQITIIDFSKTRYKSNEEYKFTTELYCIFFKETMCANIRYGRSIYDFQAASLVFMGPNQIASIEANENTEHKGWGLFFHPDILRGSNLSSNIHEYSFFNYETNESLHISTKERGILEGILDKITIELEQNIDKHSRTLIVNNLELLLNYCMRFYDRQFISRKDINKDVLVKFEKELKKHFSKNNFEEKTLPEVNKIAKNLNISPNYLSDLLKKETGKNAQEHIHYFLVEEAKNQLSLSKESISQIAYNLGFEYPQYFSRFFKNKTGYTPIQYRQLN